MTKNSNQRYRRIKVKGFKSQRSPKRSDKRTKWFIQNFKNRLKLVLRSITLISVKGEYI